MYILYMCGCLCVCMCPFNFLKKAILFTYHPSFPSFFSLSYKFSPSFSNHIILLKKEALKMSTDNNKITFYVLIFFSQMGITFG